MPIVEHIKLPSFARLRDSGQEILSLERARHQDIRELHIGFLNMMPDAALEATERQFIRLVGNCNRIAQFYVYPFSLPALPRSKKAQAYIDQYYYHFEDLKTQGLDALIITGANPASSELQNEPFWDSLLEVVHWADSNVASTLYSCLATHAILKHLYGIERQRLEHKCWGVYSHRVCQPDHPLLRDINTRFDVPHSRQNEISQQQFEAVGLSVLVASQTAGVHMAVSEDQFRKVFFQGHPEYDILSLLKEYKREIQRFSTGERDELPSLPENILPPQSQQQAMEMLAAGGDHLATRLEKLLQPLLENTWGDTAKAIISNWLGLVYQVTNLDRTQQFMAGINPQDPLSICRK